MSTPAFNSIRHHRNILGPVAIGLCGLLILGGFVAVNVLPGIGAQGADALRGLVGDQAVAQLETLVFQAQDAGQQLSYRLGGAPPVMPWAATPIMKAQPVPTQLAPTAMPRPTATVLMPAVIVLQPVTATPLPPTPTAVPVWVPAPLPAIGSLQGEGQWSVYLQNPSGQTVAYRTFLQPDPQRPYAVAAAVAFDLSATRLNFVLGSSEPISTVPMDRSGRIPTNDLQAGRLLAVFNGGFKARHGHFGAMSNGATVLPPRDGLGTVALFADGRASIGAWGTDITASPAIIAWRQNGPLLIHNGQINPHTADTAPQDWGFTVNGVTAVWRSGLGISADGRALYYVAGPSLTTTALANMLAATGAVQAMQLDINNYWVHFASVQANGSKLLAVPLLDAMNQNIGRYLQGYTRDFFYVTTTGAVLGSGSGGN